MFKYVLYNDLIVTSNTKDVIEPLNKYIDVLLGYKKNPLFILDIVFDDEICPILNIYKSLLFLSYHSYAIHENVIIYYNNALEQSKIIQLENWEINWINIIDSFINCEENNIKELLILNATSYPNDLINFRIGMVFGLYTADKILMNDLLELHCACHKNNQSEHFVSICAFILEELKLLKDSEIMILKGLYEYPDNIWLQHVYAHVLYSHNRIEESINFLVSNSYMWENSNDFLNKHIKWHLAISYLELDKLEEGNKIIDTLYEKGLFEAECCLSILGYLLRLFIRTGNICNNWTDKLLKYFNNSEIYTYHLLFDCLAIWLISYTNSDITKTLSLINYNLNISRRNRLISFKDNYLNILKALIHFGKHEYKECSHLLLMEEKNIRKLGASDEQALVIYEVELYCFTKLRDKYNYERLINDESIFDPQLKNLNIYRKLYNELSN